MEIDHLFYVMVDNAISNNANLPPTVNVYSYRIGCYWHGFALSVTRVRNESL